MPKPKPIDIRKVLPPIHAGTLTVDEARAVLLIGLYACEADGTIVDEEQVVFTELAAALRQLAAPDDPRLSDQALDTMVDEATADLDRHGREPGLARAAKLLDREIARQVAYKVAIAMGITDMDEQASEIEFDQDLAALFALSPEGAQALTSDVFTAFRVGG
jgi:tellurite resistance protein